jgi:hypothetical protein
VQRDAHAVDAERLELVERLVDRSGPRYRSRLSSMKTDSWR